MIKVGIQSKWHPDGSKNWDVVIIQDTVHIRLKMVVMSEVEAYEAAENIQTALSKNSIETVVLLD